MAKLITGLLAGFISIVLGLQQVQAQQATESAESSQTDAEKAFRLLEVPDGMNAIPLLGSRFRIDYQIDEINLLFFREKGSPSVVLVRPDGSKIYMTTFPEDSMEWYDELTFDLIKIKNPMPGPWQAVGRIAPESKIMVVTELQLHVDPMPELIITGERIKLMARVTNGGKPIEQGAFQDVVNLDVTFRSSNNSDYGNFGMDAEQVAQFRDDGHNLDEIPEDGVFTGEFDLNIAPGEWLPEYVIATPMFERELEKDAVIVLPSPIKFDYELTEVEGDYHKIHISVEGDLVDPESIIYSGELVYPDGEVHQLAINEPGEAIKTINAVNYVYGVFRVNLTAFANNRNGREIQFKVPEFTFNVEEPALQVDCTPIATIDETKPEGQQEVFVMPEACRAMLDESGDGSATTAGMDDASLSAADSAMPAIDESAIMQLPDAEPANQAVPTEPEGSGWGWLAMIIGGNLVLIIGAIVVLKFVVFRKPKDEVVFDSKNPGSTSGKATDTKVAKDSSKAEKTPKTGQKTDASDDLIDLSMDD